MVCRETLHLGWSLAGMKQRAPLFLSVNGQNASRSNLRQGSSVLKQRLKNVSAFRLGA